MAHGVLHQEFGLCFLMSSKAREPISTTLALAGSLSANPSTMGQRPSVDEVQLVSRDRAFKLKCDSHVSDQCLHRNPL